MRTFRGFTLVELIVARVIATILVSIAVPTYQVQMRKSRRTEAKTTALDAAAREERYYATQNTYTQDTGQLGYTTGSGNFPYKTGAYYEISVINSSAPTASATGVTTGTFTIVVSPAPGSPQLQDTSCQNFIVTQTGARTANDGAIPDATDSDTTSTCW